MYLFEELLVDIDIQKALAIYSRVCVCACVCVCMRSCVRMRVYMYLFKELLVNMTPRKHLLHTRVCVYVRVFVCEYVYVPV